MCKLTRQLLSLVLLISAMPLIAHAEQTTKPARFADEIAKFEADEAAHPTKAGGIVFYGSSSIRKWDVKKSFPDLPVVNRGFGGSRMDDAVTYEHRVLPSLQPKTVVLYEGDNDLADHHSSEQVDGDFEKLADAIHTDLPDAKLIVISVKPSISRWAMFGEMKKTNVLIKSAAEKRSSFVTYLDIVPLMLNEKGEPIPELFQPDHLHMTWAGYELWNKALRPLLNQ